MSAQDNLSQQLFHGTHAELKPGQAIEPMTPEPFNGAHKVAYATPDIQEAEGFAAHRAHQNNQEMGHVYEVEPIGKTNTLNVSRLFPPYETGNNVPYVESKQGFKVKGKVKSVNPKDFSKEK
jgi:Rifampin ADP-ribosyl transferase